MRTHKQLYSCRVGFLIGVLLIEVSLYETQDTKNSHMAKQSGFNDSLFNIITNLLWGLLNKS